MLTLEGIGQETCVMWVFKQKKEYQIYIFIELQVTKHTHKKHNFPNNYFRRIKLVGVLNFYIVPGKMINTSVITTDMLVRICW